MIQGKITNEQKVKASISPKTPGGKSVAIDGQASWKVVSGDVTVEVAADGLSADLISSDTPGTSQILIEADADLGSGVVTISEVIELTVEGALATSLGVSLGSPVNK
jgi:hypothetical protein